MERRHRGTIAAIAGLLALVSAGTAGAVDYSFYLGEHTDFAQCGGSNLNSITPELANYLRTYGWTGIHFMNSICYPQDYQEETIGTGGLDWYMADGHNLSAYAGHGYTDPSFGLSFGIPHNGKCRLDIDAEMRLGERVLFGANGTASYFLALTSCTLHAPKVGSVWVNSLATVGLTQVLGFHDSPRINDDEPRLFAQNVRATASRTNKNEWLDQMDNCGPWYWFCSNSPLVLSLGESESQVRDIHDTANFWYRYNDTYISIPSWYMYTYRDNGSGPCF